MAGACSVAVSPVAIRDAETAARVKTVLINDQTLGVQPIEVRVTNGIARLTGRVESEAQARRAEELAGAVAGVIAVRSDLALGASSAAPASGESTPGAAAEQFDQELGTSRDRRLLAVGVSFREHHPGSDRLASSFTVGPTVRLGSGRGAGLAFGFGWSGTDLRSHDVPGRTLGRVHLRPVMGGLGYTVRGTRTSMNFSVVGGPSFNGLSLADRLDPSEAAIDVGNSLALRAGLSTWRDVNRQIAVNAFVGYLWTRPRLTMLEDGLVSRRTFRADALVLSVGVAYKLF